MDRAYIQSAMAVGADLPRIQIEKTTTHCADRQREWSFANLMTVFAFASGTATIYSFTEEPKVINL